MREILVHVDGGARSRVRIEVAMRLAKRFGSRLTGLFAQVESHRPSAIARMPSDNLKRAEAEAAELFTDLVETSGLATRWWRLAHGEPGHVSSETVFCGRYFDLVVMGQPDPKGTEVPDDLVEEVVLNSGRPVLVVPHVGPVPTLGERIAVAWNASREASRAVHDAIPMLQAAKSVTVISLRGQDTADATVQVGLPPVDILGHLGEYGIAVAGERLAGEDIGKMDLLLSRVCDLGADLLVMGGHGHYGMSLLRGSGTRYLLKHMTLPVLLSH
ncbi:MAG: universal stress protein [Actinomycetota bacterium]